MQFNLSGSTTNNGAAGLANISSVTSYISAEGTDASTWTGNAVVGTDTTTDYVYLFNQGELDVVSPFTGHVHVFSNANAGTSEIEFDGPGTVASTANRLVTETEVMKFDDSTKSLYLNEAQAGVALEGTLDQLDLITSDGTVQGDVTNEAPLTANFVTITTINGQHRPERWRCE